jgi:hypothetical protein
MKAKEHRLNAGSRKTKLFAQSGGNQIGDIAGVVDRINVMRAQVGAALVEIFQQIEFRRGSSGVQLRIKKMKIVTRKARDRDTISL